MRKPRFLQPLSPISIVADLTSILSACPSGFCRSKDLHDRTGYYARAFMRGEARAYVGYSESLHFALQESIDNCRIGSACLSADEIAVRRLPSVIKNPSSEGIGWVDGLAISATLGAPKKDVALKFLEFATSAEGYKAVLDPQWMEAPRYLLPARQNLTMNGTLLKFDNAPLYPDLLAAHSGRKTGIAPGLNARLRELAKALNCLLPIDRTDTRSMASCKK